MIAWLTRFLLLIQLAMAAAFFYVANRLWPNAHPLLMAIGSVGAVFLFRIGITANNFLLAMKFQSLTPHDRKLTIRQACRLFIGEFNATLISSSWTMPFLAFHKRPARAPVGLPVLLIHGYGCNSGYWHAMSAVLVKARISHHAVNLEPVFADIKDYVPLIRREIELLLADSGSDQIIIVAHSMGGLATRAYLREYGSAGIAKVITLGTPHRGTGLANFGVGHNSRQMRWQGSAKDGSPSDWLRDMQTSEGDQFYKLFVSIYSHHDNIVSPQTSSYLPGAINLEFHGIGHVALALDPAIQQQVVDEIMRASGIRPLAADISDQ